MNGIAVKFTVRECVLTFFIEFQSYFIMEFIVPFILSRTPSISKLTS